MSDGDDLDLTPEEARAALAAELALGLLTGAEAEEAHRLLRGDPAFAAEVRGWHERLAALAAELPEEAPSPELRARLNDRLATAAATGMQMLPPPRRARPWGWLAGLAGAAVAALALWLLPPLLRGPPGPIAGADLVASAPVPMRVESRLLAGGRTLSVRLVEGAMPEDRDAELWWIADADAVPVSLGVAPREGEVRVALPAGLAYAPGVQLAITDEPRGGSPTGRATGPILAVAPLTNL